VAFLDPWDAFRIAFAWTRDDAWDTRRVIDEALKRIAPGAYRAASDALPNGVDARRRLFSNAGSS
jgi:hypothetical protein